MSARNMVLALAGAVALSTPALAGDFGISFSYNRGYYDGYYDDYYYDPPVVVYDRPPVYYAPPPPVVVYRSAPPVVYHRYYSPAYRTVRRYSYAPVYRSYGPRHFSAGFYYRGHHHRR